MGRSGLWNRMSDIPNCWSGYPVWDIFQLGAGVRVLDIENDRDYIMQD